MRTSPVFPGGAQVRLLLTRGAVVVFFTALFCALTRPVSDRDVWWHLAAGREIVQNLSVPSTDPFGVPGVPKSGGVYTAVALRQEWLSQVLFYGVFLLGGLKGIVVTRAALGTAVFGATYLLTRRVGAGPLVALLLTWTAVQVSLFEIPYVGERPQLWSSLFFLVVFRLMEALRAGDRRAAWLLPALMCLWSNLHGGYLIGDLVIAVYLVVGLAGRRGTRAFYRAGFLGILASGLNPAGFLAAVALVSMWLDPARQALVGQIEEYRSILDWFRVSLGFGVWPLLPAIMALAGLSFLPTLGRGRGLRAEWLLLALITVSLSFAARRYVIFFSTLAPVLIAGNAATAWRGLAWGGRQRLERLWSHPLAAGLAALALAALAAPKLSTAIAASAFLADSPSREPYAGATAFLRDEGLAGNLFSTYSEGGLLIWKLSPRIKVFIDGRGLSLAAWQEYRTLMGPPPGANDPPRQAALDRYGLDYVLVPSCEPLGRILPLVNALANDPGWALVHADQEALLFMRVTAENAAFVAARRLPPTAIFDNIIAVAGKVAGNPHLGGIAPEWMLSLAYAYWWKGDLVNAGHWVERYAALVPDDPDALALRAQVRAQPGSRALSRGD